MPTEYTSCPYCFSKKVKIDKSGPRVIVKCEECNNQIDSYPKEK